MLPRHAIACALAALALAACGERTRPSAAGLRLVVTEQVGPRSVTVAATLVEEAGGGSVGLADVDISLTPPAATARKLEAMLADASLRAPAPGTWPEAVRLLPAEARPALGRLQLGLLLAGLPDGARVDVPDVALFDGPPSAGLTRVERRGDDVSLRVLALAGTQAGAWVSYGEVRGAPGDAAVRLRGVRQVVGGAAEPVELRVERHPVGAGGGDG